MKRVRDISEGLSQRFLFGIPCRSITVYDTVTKGTVWDNLHYVLFSGTICPSYKKLRILSRYTTWIKIIKIALPLLYTAFFFIHQDSTGRGSGGFLKLCVRRMFPSVNCWWGRNDGLAASIRAQTGSCMDVDQDLSSKSSIELNKRWREPQIFLNTFLNSGDGVCADAHYHWEWKWLLGWTIMATVKWA